MFTGLPPLTLAHVIISLIAIASGLDVLIGLINTISAHRRARLSIDRAIDRVAGGRPPGYLSATRP